MNTAASLILNVDDNDGARYVKSRILENAGFTVIEAANGADTLKLLEEGLPDLVLLDVKLPDISGIEVCRLIKSNPRTANVLVLQTSAALTGLADKIRGLEGGADNYLAAPIEADELIANVNALLRLKRVTDQLYDSEERFRQVTENIDDVIWVSAVGVPGFLYVSPAYESMWQRSIAALTDNPTDWLLAVHPEDAASVSDAFRMLSIDSQYDLEYRLLLPNGKARWVRDRTYPVKDSQQRVYRIARITSDISSRKQAEIMLQESNERKNEFLATLAHELRNPLGPIRNGISLLDQVEQNASEVGRNTRRIIARQVEHLTHLVNDLLDIARIGQGKIHLRRDEVELRSFISAAIETTSHFIEERCHKMQVSLPHKRIWLIGDSVRLAQSVSNLLHNAAKFTPKGGPIQLEARLLEDGDLRISVTDRGIGIAAEDMERIFGLFSQAAVAPDRAPDGLGIGLSLVRRLVEMHGGVVSVNSPGPGQGSTFSITLPVHKVEDENTEHPEARKETFERLQKRKVLLVDDNEDSVAVMQLLLSKMGHSTFTAYDADEAMDMATQHKPEVVVLDIGLPGKSGYEVARMMRALPGLENVKLVALTGYGQEHDKQRARDAGFNHHLVKPADFDALINIIAA